MSNACYEAATAVVHERNHQIRVGNQQPERNSRMGKGKKLVFNRTYEVSLPRGYIYATICEINLEFESCLCKLCKLGTGKIIKPIISR
jgi:hypothetical protein